MSDCGCTVRGYRCVDGGELVAQAFMLAEAIESPFFNELSEAEQKQLWEEHNELTQEYMRHCGFVIEV